MSNISLSLLGMARSLASAAQKIRIVFLGAPGSGKGTYAKELAKYLNVDVLSTGDMIRDEILSGSTFGKELKQYSASGQLVPDDMVTDMLLEKLETGERDDNGKNGFILDGFPRSIKQAERLESEAGGISGVVNVLLKEDIILQKLLGRRVCSKCNKSFSTAAVYDEKGGYDMPALMWPEQCTRHMIQRADDKKDIILSRLNVYREETMPLIEYYSKEDVLKVFEVKRGLKDLPLLFQIVDDMLDQAV